MYDTDVCKEKSIYFVYHKTGDWCKYFLVKASNQREAIDKVFIKYFERQNTKESKRKGYTPFYKSDLVAKKVDKLFDAEETDCVRLY